mmetsp:Transcript_13200/g.15112  ORF Transcript_13200/g.15112 Transcript_13200/m.15112 type:complete len:351 (-) Transcript_13200:276-1328(-)
MCPPDTTDNKHNSNSNIRGSTTCNPSDSDSTSYISTPQTNIPFVAQCWITIYERIPEVNVPLFTNNNFNISFTLLSVLFLTGCRLGAEYILVHFFGWPANAIPTKEAAASCGSICHSMILCTGLIVAFTTQECDFVATIDSQCTTSKNNKWWKNFADALLQFCTGYMIYDTLINNLWIRWNPTVSLVTFEFTDDDILFLLHHFMTSFYMTSVRVLGAGYQSAMICMLLGELTNPLHNMYFIGEIASKTDCCYSVGAQRLHYGITVAFAAMYNLFRVLIAPPFFASVTYALLLTKRGRTNVPLPLNLFWNFLIWGVCFGSASWIVKCHQILKDFVATTQQQTTMMLNQQEL